MALVAQQLGTVDMRAGDAAWLHGLTGANGCVAQGTEQRHCFSGRHVRRVNPVARRALAIAVVCC